MPIPFVKDTHSYANNRLFKLFSGGFSFPLHSRFQFIFVLKYKLIQKNI